MERRRMRGVDLYGRSSLDGGPRRQAAALFTASLAAGWARGMDGLLSLEESQRAQEQVLCRDPKALPLKNRIKAQN